MNSRNQLNINLDHFWGLTILGLALIFLIFSPNKVSAYSASQIISDDVFRNASTMTEADIQAFLVSHNSYLANYTIPTPQNKSYYIRVWDVGSQSYQPKLITSYINSWIGPVGQEVDATGWPVSRVIHRASQWYGVNPQVIISILQKESSMAADSTGIDWLSAERYARMAWVMGYAYTEDPTDPAKNVCDTSTNNNPTGSCAGVAMQIDWAAGALDTWFKRSQAGTLTCNGGQACSMGRTVTIDGASVYIGNHVTGPFYRYTPHLSWSGAFTWCMQNWFTPQSSFPVSTSLWLSNTSPSAGEVVGGGYAVKNVTAAPITIDLGLPDINTQTGQWNSFTPQTGITLAAGESRYFNFSKTVMYPGPHRTWIAVGYNGTWYDAQPLANQLVSFSYTVKPLGQVISVANSIYLSNTSPAAGETLALGIGLQNTSAVSVTVDVAVPDINTQTGQWNSFTPQTGITFAPNETKYLNFSKVVKNPGPHRTWVAINLSGSWYDAKPLATQMTSFSYPVRTPNIRLDYYYFDTLPPRPNEKFNAYLSITNLESTPITVDAGVPIYDTTKKTWNTMLYSAMGLTLNPNTPQPIAVYQTLPTSTYSIWPSVCTVGYCFTPKTSTGIEMFWAGRI